MDDFASAEPVSLQHLSSISPAIRVKVATVKYVADNITVIARFVGTARQGESE
jgi:hypothetical protein